MKSFRQVLPKRLFNAFLTILMIMMLNFVLFRVMPGDPAILMLNRNPDQDTDALYEANVERMGLDEHWTKQIIPYYINTFIGEWGDSYIKKAPVLEVVGRALAWTSLLLVWATVLTFALGVYLGKIAARRRGKPSDMTITAFGIFFYGMPIFWFGIVLMVIFCGQLQWLPSGGYITAGVQPFPLTFEKVYDLVIHMLLPGGTLVIGAIAGIVLIQRNSLVDVLTEDYIVTAYAKGLSEKQVMKKHATPNARLPVVTTLAMDTAFILGGAFQVEYVFSYKGIGWLTIEAIDKKDYPLLQCVFLIGGVAVVIANLIADLLLVKLDPRVSIT